MEKSHKKWIFFSRMVMEWRYREHEDVDREFHQDVNAQQDLKICGLYKFCKARSFRVLEYWTILRGGLNQY